MQTALAVVDVQPAYDTWCGTVARAVAQRINNTRKPTVIFWVGDGITTDTEDDVRHYLREAGIRPGKLADNCRFIEKDYGFFRAWMDNCVPDNLIVRVGQEMFRTDIHCSEELDIAGIFPAFDTSVLPQYDHLRLPTFDDRSLRLFDAFDTCGGGNRECLAEMELYFEMKGQPATRLDHLVY